jgi:hypothetical protein
MTARQHRVKLSPCGSGSVVPLPGRLPSHRPPGTLSADRGAGLVLAVGGTVSPVTCVDWKAKKRAKVLVADRAKCDGEEKGRERIGVPFVRLAQKQSCLKVAGGSSCSGTGPGKAQPADSPQVPCTALKQRRARDWRYPATVTKQRCPSCDHRRWPHAIPPTSVLLSFVVSSSCHGHLHVCAKFDGLQPEPVLPHNMQHQLTVTHTHARLAALLPAPSPPSSHSSTLRPFVYLSGLGQSMYAIATQ